MLMEISTLQSFLRRKLHEAGRETTFEERVQIVRECIAIGKNYGEIALKYQVSYQQVRAGHFVLTDGGRITRPAWTAQEGPNSPYRFGTGTN